MEKMKREMIKIIFFFPVAAWWTALLPQTLLRCAVWTQRYEDVDPTNPDGKMDLKQKLKPPRD